MILSKTSSIVLFTIFLIGCTQKKELPILSNYIDSDGKKVSYTVNDFEFTNQLNQPFTTENTYNTIYIANFFFTSCPSICPPMRNKLIDIANNFDEEKFKLLSFTIDLENDSIEVLKEYSENTGISNDKWKFLRGDTKQLDEIAKKFRTSFSKYNDSSDFYHSSFVALVDSKQQIRGFYNVLEEEAIVLLKEDINVLLSE